MMNCCPKESASLAPRIARERDRPSRPGERHAKFHRPRRPGLRNDRERCERAKPPSSRSGGAKNYTTMIPPCPGRAGYHSTMKIAMMGSGGVGGFIGGGSRMPATT